MWLLLFQIETSSQPCNKVNAIKCSTWYDNGLSIGEFNDIVIRTLFVLSEPSGGKICLLLFYAVEWLAVWARARTIVDSSIVMFIVCVAFWKFVCCAPLLGLALDQRTTLQLQGWPIDFCLTTRRYLMQRARYLLPALCTLCYNVPLCDNKDYFPKLKFGASKRWNQL